VSKDDFLSLIVVGDKAVLRNFEQLPLVAQAIIVDKVEQLTQQLEDAVVQSIENLTTTQTGKLIGAVESHVSVQDGRIEGEVYIDSSMAPYARALDKGAQIPAHIIRPVNSKLLAFRAASGDKVLALRVFHPGAYIEPRNFMREARYEADPAKMTRALKTALVKGIQAHMRSGQ
jgi:hypothetical protein